MFSIITPILILGIFNINRMDYIGGSNAFYFVLLMAISVGSLVKTSKNMSIISVFLISVFILTGISFKRPPRSKNIDYLEKHALIKQITNETNKDLLTLNEIDMKVLNNNFPNNNGNWDSSIYWYLLQKNSKTQLVDSSYPFLVPELINQKPKVTYFICEYENSSPNVKDCLTKINHDYDYSSKNMNRVLSESNKIILIKSKTNLNHNLNQDE